MTLISMLAILFILVGFAVLARRILSRGSGVRFLTERRVDPHLWGYHLLGAGALLALLPWVFRDRSWAQLPFPGHVAVSAAILWAGVALAISSWALFRRVGSEKRWGVIPEPGLPARHWPLFYRGFLGSGFAILFALAVVAL